MKFYSSIITILSAFVLFSSCEKHDIIEDNEVPEIVYDATFSLAVKHNGKVKTKAEESEKPEDEIKSKNHDFIKNLTLAVFQNEILVAFKEEKSEESDDPTKIKGVYKIEELEVPSGNAKVLLLANVNIGETYREVGKTKLSSFQEMTVHLEKEINGSLSMCSGILNFTFAPGHNYVGYSNTPGNVTVDVEKGIHVDGKELVGSAIAMKRTVSRVYLEYLGLHPKKEFQGVGNVTFTIKDYYIANVKNESKLVPNNEGSVEMNSTDPSFWWCGNFTEEEGALKAGEATKNLWMYYDVTNPPTTGSEMNGLYPFLNNDRLVCEGLIFGRDADKNSTFVNKIDYQQIDYKEDPHIMFGFIIPLGTYHYVYENHSLGTNKTLLIVKGDYTYTPVKGGKAQTLKDRYYTVVVNEKNILSNHEYIKRNYQYAIALTITGPGSDKPYDPQSTADISAEIKVEDWDVVNQDEPNLE